MVIGERLIQSGQPLITSLTEVPNGQQIYLPQAQLPRTELIRPTTILPAKISASSGLPTARGSLSSGAEINPYQVVPGRFYLPNKTFIPDMYAGERGLLEALFSTYKTGEGEDVELVKGLVYGEGCDPTTAGEYFRADVENVNRLLARRGLTIVQDYKVLKDGYTSDHKIRLSKLAPVEITPLASAAPTNTEWFVENDTASLSEKTSQNGKKAAEIPPEEVITLPPLRAFDLSYLTDVEKTIIRMKLPALSAEYLEELSYSVSPSMLEGLARRIPANFDNLEEYISQSRKGRGVRTLDSEDLKLIELLTPFYYYRMGRLQDYTPIRHTAFAANMVVRSYLKRYSDLNPAVGFQLLKKELAGGVMTEEETEKLLFVRGAKGVYVEAPPELEFQVALQHQLTAEQSKLLEKMWVESSQVVYSYLYYKVSNGRLAEDLRTETYIRAAASLDRYQQKEGVPFQHWLLRLARNLTIDYYRSAKTVDGIPVETSPDEEPEKVLEREELKQSLQVAAHQLSAEQREVIVLRFIEQQPHAEVARHLGKSADTVRVIQHRALRNLKKILQEEEADRPLWANAKRRRGTKFLSSVHSMDYPSPELAVL